MKVLGTLLMLLAVATPAAAKEADPKAPPPSYINISPVALPIIVRGQLLNYVFVNVRVDLAPNTPTDTIRPKEPFFRDALVRAAHRTPFIVEGDYTRIDEAKLCASLLADIRSITPDRGIIGVRVMAQTPKSTKVTAPR